MSLHPLPHLLGLFVAAAVAFALGSGALAADPPTMARGGVLAAADGDKLAAARAAVMHTPEMKAETAKFNAARRAYQEDRRKFPSERDRSVALAFRKATEEYGQAQRQALLAHDPSLAPLLEREAAARMNGRRRHVGETLGDSDSPRNAAIHPVEEVPGLPRVLIVGDSISIGYTLQVRKLLEGKANVQRIPVNGGATEVGLANMKKWLGAGKWDVIHFNFGLHDAKHVSPAEARTSRDQYAENLRRLVAEMKASGAALVFATTTPVPNGGALAAGRIFDDIAARNEVALRVMKANDVAVDDLYSVVLPQLARVGRPNDVHFQPEGYELLAKAVAESIEARLPKN